MSGPKSQKDYLQKTSKGMTCLLTYVAAISSAYEITDVTRDRKTQFQGTWSKIKNTELGERMCLCGSRWDLEQVL